MLCKHCGRSNNHRPSIFKGLPYCSIVCGKALGILK